MDEEIAKDKPSVYADNQSIAIGEINISGTVTGNITIGSPAAPVTDARLRHELGILLKNVQTTWIKGVLEKSVHEAALLELGLELREEAVDNPWRMVIEGPNQAQQILPRGKRIKDIFDEANRLLWILGEPGSGKTTTLLQLARDLIAEVDLSTFTQPVPVILNLSTWTNKAQPLDEWLVAELNSKYRLPKKDGQRWLKDRRILPLLDSLDEVRAENRAACVEKLNQLVVDYGLQGMVVCSRIKDYTALNIRLAFYRAIYIQSLTPEQVDEYLNEAGDKLASLRETLHADEALRSMAQSPLILNIMSLAYQNTSTEDLSNRTLTTNKARRKHLFDTYIIRMFNRKVGTREYDNQQTQQRLSWLAQNMQKHNQDVFLIEGLQPSWLRARHLQWIYVFASRLMLAPILGLIGVFYESGTNVIITGLIVGLSLGLIDGIRFEVLRKHPRIFVSSNDQGTTVQMIGQSIFWWTIINIMVVGLIGWLSFGLGFALGSEPWEGLSSILYFVLGDAALLAPFFGLFFGYRGRRQNLENDIQTIEALHLSSIETLAGGLIGAIGGLILGLLGGLVFGVFKEMVLPQLIKYLLFFALIFGPIGAIINGLRHEIIETKTTPNQGIRLSMRNASFVGLSLGLFYGLFLGLLFPESRANSLMFGLSDWQFSGLLSGLAGAFWYGGLSVIQHYILRLILIIQGHTPANYARFLDYAVDRILLQKVGGGYRFIHRLLLEHFAEMGEAKKV